MSTRTSIAEQRAQNIAGHLAGNDNTVPEFEKYRICRKPGQAPYHTPMTPIRLLLRSALAYPNKTAVIHGDRSLSYKVVADRVLRLANLLIRTYNIRPGDRVAVLCQNIPAFLDAKFGIPSAGAIIVPLNTRLTQPEIEYIISHSGASVLIVQQELLPRVSEKVIKTLLKRAPIVVANYQNKGDAPCHYEQKLYATEPQILWNDLPLPQEDNAIISLNYTSGSTGRPKGVMISHKGCYMQGLSMCIHGRLTPESVYLWTLPMFHCNGWNFPWAVVAAGGTQVMLNKMDYGYIWKAFKELGVTHYCGAPTVQNEICNHQDASRLDRTVLTFGGGAALSSTHIRNLNALNIFPTHLYGLTESYGPSMGTYDQVSLSNYPEEDHFKLVARQGYNTITIDEARVLNRETAEDVKPDGKQIGEICLTGNTIMLGYYNNPEETEKAFKHGVFWTGDLAVRHPDGAIEIVDRSKDVIVSGGENISSIEVESAILYLDQVSECTVIGGPDPKWGERPYAFVIPKQGHTLTPEAVVAHCRKNLAGYKCPAEVLIVQSVPKTSTGKVQKFVLREELWKSYKNRVN